MALRYTMIELCRKYIKIYKHIYHFIYLENIFAKEKEKIKESVDIKLFNKKITFPFHNEANSFFLKKSILKV